jgi:hypothetical protein
MDDEGIVVTWPVVILSENGKSAIYGRLSWLGKNRVVVGMDQDMPSGQCFTIVLKVPKSRQDEEEKLIKGSGQVISSVLSATKFHINFRCWKLKVMASHF